MRSRRRPGRLLLRLCLLLLAGLWSVGKMYGNDVQDEEPFAATGRTRAVKARESTNWGIIRKIITAYYQLLCRCVMRSLGDWVLRLYSTTQGRHGGQLTGNSVPGGLRVLLLLIGFLQNWSRLVV